jgi:hypothetical protein
MILQHSTFKEFYMANLIYDLIGVRGRRMKLYDTKCVITTDKTVGSFITGNIADGEKTIFLKDVVGVQFKKSGMLIGYLQFETPSMQMNNQKDNMFSENTFTYEAGKNGITNELIEEVYNYVVDRIEGLKYGEAVVPHRPAPATPIIVRGASADNESASVMADSANGETHQPKEWHPIAETTAIKTGETNIKCLNCDCVQFSGNKSCKRCGAKFTKIETLK